MSEWNTVLMLCVILSALSGVQFLIYGSGIRFVTFSMISLYIVILSVSYVGSSPISSHELTGDVQPFAQSKTEQPEEHHDMLLMRDIRVSSLRADSVSLLA